MTKEERLIVTAYTGVFMVEEEEFYDYLETLMGRPILAKELKSEEFVGQVISAVKDDFAKLCEDPPPPKGRRDGQSAWVFRNRSHP